MVIIWNGCSRKSEKGISLIERAAFDKIIDDEEVSLFTLRGGNLVMQVTNFGGRVIALWTPDREGKYEDVVLGFPNIDEYANPRGERFLGPIVGRYANRIADGRFTLDGIEYTLPKNNNGQTLHGGLKGLDMVVWKVDAVDESSIALSYTSPDGADGFPGELSIRMIYSLTSEDEFVITCEATTDRSTVVNLTHHGVFNLLGEGGGSINGHILTINADAITPVNEVLIPTGELMPVEGTPFDFRQARAIGEYIDDDHEQLRMGKGYDHNWVLARERFEGAEFAARLYEPESGRVMEVWTNQPGLQFYSGNFFDGGTMGKHGHPHYWREGLALEPQKFPDSPNHAEFPSTRLNPGEAYFNKMTYRFFTE